MKNKFIIRDIDFYKYLFKINRNDAISLLVGVVIFLVSLFGIIKKVCTGVTFDSASDISMILLFGYSIFNVIWDFFGKIQEINKFAKEGYSIILKPKRCIIKDDKIINMSDLEPEQEKGWSDFIIDEIKNPSGNKISIYSKEINEYLWDNDLKIERSDRAKDKLMNFIKNNKQLMLPFLQFKYYDSKINKRMLFNEQKLCMDSNITLDSNEVSCYKSDYFSSLITNEFCGYSMIREDGTIIYDATNFYPCEHKNGSDKYILQSLKRSNLCNDIGISTLAISKDNYIIIRKQSKKNQQSANKLAPTGSGSCDWGDIRENSINKTVEYAMNRELWEENGKKIICKDANSIGQTKILGYFRWIDRGAKPEFVGITKLNYCINELEINKDELEDLSNHKISDCILINNVKELKINLQSLLEKDEELSLPLLMCIKSILQYIECAESSPDRMGWIKKFLNID